MTVMVLGLYLRRLLGDSQASSNPSTSRWRTCAGTVCDKKVFVRSRGQGGGVAMRVIKVIRDGNSGPNRV